MQDLNVTLVQAKQFWENKSQNLAHYEDLLNEVENTDLILLPEMFHTSFTMNASEHAEQIESGTGIDWLIELSKDKRSCIYTSLIIEEKGKYYNMGVFVRPNGEITTYAKRKTFGLAKEDQHFAAGSKEVIVELKGWKIQLQICYDLRFPEIVRNRIESNGEAAYDLILYVANWPERRNLHWKTLLCARAIENQCYVVGVNRVGEDGNGLIYSGESRVCDPLGEIDALPTRLEVVKTVRLNVNMLKNTRKSLPFLKDR